MSACSSDENIGFEVSGTISPSVAAGGAPLPTRTDASNTRFLVLSLTISGLLNTRDTVAGETPASKAISSSVFLEGIVVTHRSLQFHWRKTDRSTYEIGGSGRTYAVLEPQPQ